MTAYVLGIDFGSTTGKAVILDDTGAIVAAQVSQKGAVSDEGVRVALAAALAEAGITEKDVARTVSTGYGRRMLDIADQHHHRDHLPRARCGAPGAGRAHGARHRRPGQQGSSPSTTTGSSSQFAMNDRCAAGTGKFLETLARAVNVPIDEMGTLALQAKDKLQVTSMCATFGRDRGDLDARRGHRGRSRCSAACTARWPSAPWAW